MTRETPDTVVGLIAMIGNAIPIWARICIISLMLVGWIWVETGHVPAFFPGFARRDELTSSVTAVAQQVGAQIAHVESEVTDVSSAERNHYMQEIGSQILDDTAKCKDTKSADSKQLYAQEISNLVTQYRQLANNTDPPEDFRRCSQ